MFLKKIYIFIWKSELHTICWLVSQMAIIAEEGPTEARVLRFHPGLSCACKGLKHWGHLLLPFQAYEQQSELEMEQLGHGAALTWDVSLSGSNLTHCMTTL